MFVLCSVGDDDRTRTWEERLGGSFMGGFFGSPAKVASSLHELAGGGIAGCS